MFYRLQSITLAFALLATAAFIAGTMPAATAQTITTGALTGTVTDATGAAVPGAKVTVINSATDARLIVATDPEGRYTVNQLNPGKYTVSANAANLRSETMEIDVLVGATVTGNIQVTPSGNITIVQVSASTLPIVDTENIALATTLNSDQIQNLPTPGGDVTTVAFTAPGISVNAGGAYGNFSSNGLPGISNLFVLNGFDNEDPFLNLNNSGSSNLTLGQGELADATVIQNAYNSQYGRAAGAIISYTTKSGSNAFHGEAVYDYNGTVLNANGWFNNFSDTPRPHAVSNEWALNGGGPIVRNKLFFFSDWEGLHYVLPASGYVSLPSSQYQAFAIANVPSGATSTYTTMMNLYKNAPSFGSATPVSLLAPGTDPNDSNPLSENGGGCGAQYVPGEEGTSKGFLGGMYDTPAPGGQTWGVTVPCALSAYAQANNINQESLFTQRIDWNVSDKQKLYGRFKMDRGSQPTSTSFINPVFNAVSVQPEYEGQFNDGYTISPNMINTAVIAANWYTAFFGLQNPAGAAAALPFEGYFNVGADGSGTPQVGGFTNVGAPFYFPQGRNVTQYQLEDDLSWIRGKHSLEFGVNFRRDLVTDFDQQQETAVPWLLMYSLNDIAQGQVCGANSAFCGADYFQQAFISSNDAHLAMYNVGFYAQDEWQALPTLKLTLGARIDRTGSPLCKGGCFSLYNGNFGSASLTTPYSQLINSHAPHAYSVDPFYFQPRFGFNYQLAEHTVIRGGVGYFADLYPAGFLDGPVQNFPNYNLVTIYGGNIATAGAGSMYADTNSANAAIQNGFQSGNATSINTALYNQNVPFSPPNLNAYFGGKFHEPEYVEYSLQIQHQFTKSDGLSLTYAGNYGYNEIIQNPFENASSGIFSSASTPSATAAWTSAGSIGGLPAAPPNQAFGEVNAYTNNAHSNDNSAMLEYTHIGQGITAHLSYTYAHSLDEISNGGVGEFYNYTSLTKQLTPALGPGNLNYSNSDYDIRNALTGDLIYTEPYKARNAILNYAVGGWTVGAKTYFRSGMPFSVVNSDAIGGFPTMSALNNTQGATSMMPQVSSYHLTNTCGSNPHGAVTAPCLDVNQYSTGPGFGNLRRNSLYGPHYANTDATLMKKMYQRESMAFEIGAQAFNIFNHANFANPGNAYNGDTADKITSSSFGSISGVLAPPTSPYGSFQSAAVTQRVLVVTGRITF